MSTERHTNLPSSAETEKAPVRSVSQVQDEQKIYDGLSVKLSPAPFVKRVVAYCVDLGIISAISYFLLLIFSFSTAGVAGIAAGLLQLSKQSSGIIALVSVLLGLLVLLVLYDGYFIFFENRSGSTPGKRLFGLKVISLRGDRLTLGQCVLRETFRHIDAVFGVLAIVGVISILVTKKKQRFGDLIAATMVIYSRQKETQADYLYVTQEDFQWLSESVQLFAVPEDVCRAYLTFAYPRFLLNQQTASERDLEHWDGVAAKFVSGIHKLNLDREGRLRLFAEHCFRILNYS